MTDKKFSADDYELIERKILYQGIFRLACYQLRHRLYDGEWSQPLSREVLERKPASAILPYDPISDRVILIEQFRPAVMLNKTDSPWLIEVPAGVMDQNETPAEVAMREAIEEANCHIQTIVPICDYFPSPGGTNEYLSLFCGKIAAEGIQGVYGLKHEDEDIRIINLPREEALEKFYAGEIKSAPAIIALLWLNQHHAHLKKIWT